MIATGHLGRILLARGEPGAAQHLDQAVQLARAFAVRPLLAWWLDSLGELAELEGRYGDARSWYEQAADHAAECGLPVDAARVRHHWGGWPGCGATGRRRSTAATRRWPGNSRPATTWGWSKRWRPLAAC